MAKLTAKQMRFIEEYLVDLNAAHAAVRAGYSPRTAKVIGGENLTKPDLRARIDAEIAKRSVRTGINQDRVVRELARIALVDPTKVLDTENGGIQEGISEDDRAAIQSVRVKRIPTDVGEGIEFETRLADKLKALELLGRHLGMFTDRMQVQVTEAPKIVDDIS
jgi:phage terminase small subunit